LPPTLPRNSPHISPSAQSFLTDRS
jgi:hypothetical protein